MIRYLKHTEIDKPKWDKCIQNSSNGLIYAYSWYLDFVSPNWQALVRGDYEYVMPLTCKKKHGINYLHQPFFAQQLGVFSSAVLSYYDVDEFLSVIPQKFKLVEINLNSKNPLLHTDLSYTSNTNYELNLIDNYETLYKTFSENTVRNLKKASKENLHIKKNIDVDEIIKLFRSNRGKNIDKITAAHYNAFSKLIRFCEGIKAAETWGVFTAANTLCAGAVFVSSNNRSIFIFSGLSDEGKQKGAMFFLFNEFIREHSGKNIVLDFEGSNDKNLARFYKSFGSKECVYLQVRKNSLPKIIRWLKK